MIHQHSCLVRWLHLQLPDSSCKKHAESQGKISKEERKPVHFCDLDIPLVVVEEALLLTASVRIPRRRHPPLRYQNKKEGDPKLFTLRLLLLY